MAYENHWPPGFNFNVEEWDAKGLTYETLAICRTLAVARAVFAAAVAEKPAGRFMIRRSRVVHDTRRAIGESPRWAYRVWVLGLNGSSKHSHREYRLGSSSPEFLGVEC